MYGFEALTDAMLCELEAGGDVVLCGILASSGSSPRGAGAHMAVFSDGRTLGTIGGGAVELNAASTAMRALRDKTSFTASYCLHKNEVADIGMICGGSVTVYFEYYRGASPQSYAMLAACKQLMKNNVDAWIIRRVSGGGNPIIDGAALYDRQNGLRFQNEQCGADGGITHAADGEVDGTAVGGVDGTADGGVDGTAVGGVDGTAVGGVDGTADGGVDGTAVGGQASSHEKFVDVRMLEGCFTHSGGCVKGETFYYVEPISSSGVVYLFGGGHVGRALVPVLSSVDFRVIVLDNRPDVISPKYFPKASQILLCDYQHISDYVSVCKNDYVVIMTPAHHADYEVLSQILRTEATYIGCIGSRHKVAATRQRLVAEGFSDADCDRVHSPIGLPIGGETPEEIAVSIAAEMIMHRSGEQRPPVRTHV